MPTANNQQSIMSSFHNIFAVLVHERPDCVLDLVRNLRYLDPDSAILLYNGGTDTTLLQNFPFERYGAVMHPESRPMKWGRLHGFAIDCMRFARDNLPFTTLTVVDSDQLALRPGYSGFLQKRLRDGAGLLSSSPLRQDHTSRFAPVRAALLEFELWRPFLERFPNGAEKFVHWTFWPSTVFTAAAARGLVRLFDEDTQLNDILSHSRIWATEEIILPTLVALLGYRIEANPCCSDWVQFRTRYRLTQLRAALSREEAFWIHPIPRLMDDSLRSAVRAHFNQYVPGPRITDAQRSSTSSLLLTQPIVTRMKQIEGWLDEDEADLLVAATATALNRPSLPRTIVEVGSYCGRSTTVFGSVVKTLGAQARVYAIDPHDGKLGALGQRIVHAPPSLAKFRRAMEISGLHNIVETIQAYAPNVRWDKPIGLLFIDHLHDYESVAADFTHFEPWLAQYGYVVFHDYADYFPGVQTFVNELLDSGRYRKVEHIHTAIVIEKLVIELPTQRQRPRPTPAVLAPRAAPAPEPHNRLSTLAQFRNKHDGETVIVCGCGESLNDIDPADFVTIGVNDIGRRFDPNYLVVVNPPQQFSGDRFQHVRNSRAQYLFTQLDLGPVQPATVRFRLGRFGGTEFSDPNALDYTQNSPYVALCLAAHMGAKRIGVIGVDFTDHHFFAKTGVHPLNRHVAQIDTQYLRLYESLLARGIKVYNLSSISRLTAFPRKQIQDFTACTNSEGIERMSRRLNIVSYATTPVAGVPSVLARCISARTPHAARCVWANNSYGNGVRFQGDIEWNNNAQEATRLLTAADIVIVHNGKVDPAHRNLLSTKPVITLAHNYMWNVDRQFVDCGFPGAVVGQYQATLPEFKDWTPVPNPVPWWENEYRSGIKPQVIALAYTPSGKHERYPPGHRLYWHSKGYASTVRIMERLAQRLHVRLNVIRNGQVSHAEALAMKRDAHIVIDECITGSYHRNSLEGLAAGCVVVNGLGLLPGVTEVLRDLSEESGPLPFVSACLDNLEAALAELITQGSVELTSRGRTNRQWLQQHWDFGRQWERFWVPLINRAVETSEALRLPSARSATTKPSTPENVSVVIPHGGSERLPHLVATLTHLRETAGVGEIIIAEMGTKPIARDIAHRFKAKYVFIYNDQPFERARSLNVGSALANSDLVLWLDNDLAVPTDFIVNAIREIRHRGLDYLIPYTCIHYLTEADSGGVVAGTSKLADCRAAKILTSARHISGGAGLVRRSFLHHNGGFDERFCGWGGEDNAWLHKAGLLGKSAATQRHDQNLYHLYHPRSGAHAGNPNAAANPHYGRNLALLTEIRKIRNVPEFIRRYPPRRYSACPWPSDRRITFIVEDIPWHSLVESVTRELVDLYGIDVKCKTVPTDELQVRDVRDTDALVLFGTEIAMRFFGDAAMAKLWPTTITVLTAGDNRADALPPTLTRAATVATTATPQTVEPMRLLLLPDASDARSASRYLVEPLSILLGHARYIHEPSKSSDMITIEHGDARIHIAEGASLSSCHAIV